MKTQAELALIQQPNGSELMPEVVNGKVDARAVHEALEVASEFAKWFDRRVEEFGFVEGEDFSSCMTKTALVRNRTDYVVSLDMAKELAMVERNEMGRKMRRYFIACEKQVQASAPVAALGGIPHGTLLKLQEINAGMIEVVGEHATRIQELEAHMRPGPDWMSPADWLHARGIRYPQAVWPGRLAQLSKSCTHRSAVLKLLIGTQLLRSGHGKRTFSPEVLNHVGIMYHERWERRDMQEAQEKGATHS